jgi:SAM-dependent methyltransferase
VATEAPLPAEVEAGQAVYSRFVLASYDAFVLGFSARFAWRCPRRRMLAQYDDLAGPRHLDVGVGTGWFLEQCRWRGTRPEVTLLDLNENSLRTAAGRIARLSPRRVRGNVLQRVDLGDARFDSIGLNYLLHCLPGGIETKAATVVGNLKSYLVPGGVLFGSTLLGAGVRHNVPGRFLMRVYNRKGIFSNAADDAAGLERALARDLRDVDVRVEGVTALFSARA